MFNRKIGKIGISMLTLAALTMGGQTVFAASQGNIQVDQIENSNAPYGRTAATMNDEESIKYLKTLIGKDTMILDKASGKMINASDADLTNKETLNAVIEELTKEGKISKAIAVKSSEEGNIEVRTINLQEQIKELITKDTMYYNKETGKMINASDADLTNSETLNAVIEALIKEGEIAKAVAAEGSETENVKQVETKRLEETEAVKQVAAERLETKDAKPEASIENKGAGKMINASHADFTNSETFKNIK